MMNYSAAIDADALTVHRGGRAVLDGLDLRIPAGQVTGLLGPSGCGKSTLMRAIAGVQRIRSGTITVLGLPAGHPKLRTRLGYVTQAPSIYDDLTVLQNLRYFARVLGAPRSEVERCLDAVDLAPERDALAGRLSGGQRSRVSLAAALLGRPEVLVLDEPTVGLDPLLRQELWQLFRQQAEHGVTVLVSSHVMDEASRCDRLLLMRQGQLLADDSPAALLERTGAADVESAFLTLIAQTGRNAA